MTARRRGRSLTPEGRPVSPAIRSAGDAYVAYRTVVLADQPAAYWRLGESSGTTAADELGTHNGTFQGSPTLGVAGALSADAYDDDTGASFSGSGQYVEFSDHADFDLPSSGGFTVELWAWKDDNSPAQSTALVFRGQSSSAAPKYDWIVTQSTNGRCAFVIHDGASNYYSCALEADDTGLMTPGRWHHLVGVWDADAQEIRTYLNGDPVRTVAAAIVPATAADRFELARRPDLLTNSHFDGKLDEVAIYRHALTESQVQEHYERGQGSFVPASYMEAVLDDGPLAYWRLGESSGTTADDELGTHNGTVTGPTKGIAGAVDDGDTAYRFDGVNDRVTFPDTGTDLDLTELTLEAWVKDRQPGFVVMQGNGGGSLYNWGLFRVSGGAESFCLYIRADATTVHSAAYPDPKDGNWHHLVGTYDGQILRLYLDGTEVASNDLGAPVAPTTYAGQGGMSVWVHASAYSYAQGDLDEVAIYPRALTAEEVADHYEKGTA